MASVVRGLLRYSAHVKHIFLFLLPALPIGCNSESNHQWLNGWERHVQGQMALPEEVWDDPPLAVL